MIKIRAFTELGVFNFFSQIHLSKLKNIFFNPRGSLLFKLNGFLF